MCEQVLVGQSTQNICTMFCNGTA